MTPLHPAHVYPYLRNPDFQKPNAKDIITSRQVSASLPQAQSLPNRASLNKPMPPKHGNLYPISLHAPSLGPHVLHHAVTSCTKRLIISCEKLHRQVSCSSTLASWAATYVFRYVDTSPKRTQTASSSLTGLICSPSQHSARLLPPWPSIHCSMRLLSPPGPPVKRMRSTIREVKRPHWALQ